MFLSKVQKLPGHQSKGFRVVERESLTENITIEEAAGYIKQHTTARTLVNIFSDSLAAIQIPSSSSVRSKLVEEGGESWCRFLFNTKLS